MASLVKLVQEKLAFYQLFLDKFHTTQDNSLLQDQWHMLSKELFFSQIQSKTTFFSVDNITKRFTREQSR